MKIVSKALVAVVMGSVTFISSADAEAVKILTDRGPIQLMDEPTWKLILMTVGAISAIIPAIMGAAEKISNMRLKWRQERRDQVDWEKRE